jgi:hypothetical protein
LYETRVHYNTCCCKSIFYSGIDYIYYYHDEKTGYKNEREKGAEVVIVVAIAIAIAIAITITIAIAIVHSKNQAA